MTTLLKEPGPIHFEHARPVRPDDACFVPDVYQLDGFPVDESRLLAALSTTQPLSVTAPSVQGKASFLAYAEALARRRTDLRWIRFTASENECSTASTYLERLSRDLECSSRAWTLAQAVVASERLRRIRIDGQGVVLLLNLTGCSSRDLTEWLMASIAEDDAMRESDFASCRAKVVVVTRHSHLDPASAPRLGHGDHTVTISNLSFEQNEKLLTRGAGGPRNASFDEPARRAVFHHARGDKYFTNLIASIAQHTARGSTAGVDDPRVTEAHVNLSAHLLTAGIAAEKRVLPGLSGAIAARPEIANAVEALCEGGGDAWMELRPSVRASLEELGAVGPLWERPRPTPSALRPKTHIMTLRNPMLQAAAAVLVAERRRQSRVALSTAPAVPDSAEPLDPTDEPLSPGSGPETTPSELAVGPFRHFQVGETRYEFRDPLTATYSAERSELQVPALKAMCPGVGPSPAAAFRDWGHRFHLRFQRLFGKPGPDMTPSERNAWEDIRRVVDVETLAERQTFDVRQIGLISKVHSSGLGVEWEDGSKETLDLGILPAACLRLPPGQRIEAIVRRATPSYEAARVVYVRALPALPDLTDAEMERLWESLPGASSRPAASWD